MTTPNDHDGLSLPGYSLVSRLGAGGYGEVWLAHAPGGLTKAVKFVYGSYNDKRAEHELRAMQRVKEVRHPFLLSLERIEVVDSRLVIVTELAEGSLKDRFDECRNQGLVGIPRAELLGYLRDAADGLDYLSQKHSLQHLDVKPENLLLVGGHVKVADFGLVKDVGKSQASLVGGLTPLYSAPEVFQGNPSTNSDQYSLAVLYQEMLTGVMPFPGVTAAELTLQHLHDEPDVSVLPTGDRYVLSRALAKDPAQRFAACGDLVQALLAGAGTGDSWSNAGDGEPATPALRAGHAEAGAPRRVTEFFDEQIESCQREASTSMLIDLAPQIDVEPQCLPSLETSGEGFRAQPTLVIGVGGVAGAVLKQLRLRLSRQYGEERLAAVQMLFLDSDPKAIARAMQGDPRGALKPDETLALPLRRPQDYREQSAKLMRWLSRRWLYNIPRSLRTEGMRPLGRLALVDHARQAVQRIRMALAAATAPEACDASQEQTGLEFAGQTPRVYLVASVSGGAGSGMSLDVACAVRAALMKMGAADAQVIGVFLRATDRDPRRCDLAKVNAFAWLTEYNQFHRPGAQFSGDESCGLPPLPAGKPALSCAYLVDASADGLEEGVVDPAVQAVAEYVYLDALTPAQMFFDRCRSEGADLPSAVAPLRTFSVQRIPAASEEAVEQAGAALSRQVVLAWAGIETIGATQHGQPPSVRDTNQLVQGAAKLVGQLQLKLEGLASNARSLVEAQFGGDQQAFLDNLLPEPHVGKASAADALQMIDRLFATPNEDSQGEFVFDRPVEAIVSPLVMKLAGDLVRWVLAKLDDRQERLAGAQRGVDWLVEHLKRVEADAGRLAAGLARQTAEAAELTRRDHPTGAAARERVLAYFRMRVDHHAVAASGFIARRLLAELKSIGATIGEFGRHLKHMAASLPRVADAEDGAAAPAATNPLAAALAYQAPTIADAIDAQLQEEFIDPQGGLFQTIMGNSRVRAQMLSVLNKISRRAAQGLASRPDVMNAAFAALAGGEATANPATPKLPEFLQHGGVYRNLVVAPAQCPGAQATGLWSGLQGADASLLVAPGQEVVTVCEGWQLPLVRLGIGLIQNRRDYADFAARVHTRSDVDWLPLTAAASAAPVLANAFGDLSAGPRMTQVIN